MKAIINRMFLSVLLGVSVSQADTETAVETLSPELRVLLQQEMTAIEKGMRDIVSAYISGDLKTIGSISNQLENSFILKQKLTVQQKQELHDKLPKDFIEKDKQSHQYARRLEQASTEKNVELVGVYYTKLLESCISCHSVYAVHKFPSLINITNNSLDYYY